MDPSSILALALLGYIAWRERSHAAERRELLSRCGGGAPPAPVASSRRREKGEVEPARVLSPEDDKGFNALKDGETPPAAEGDE